jgi:hypothetical protein
MNQFDAPEGEWNMFPDLIWEITYRRADGDDVYYRTPPMPFDRACAAALHDTPDGTRLIRIERIPPRIT